MTKRDGRALWRALQQQQADDELEDIMAMSDEELDKYINENGGDAAAIRKSGGELAEELFAQRGRLGWHAETEKEHGRVQSAAARPREKLPRAELLRRLEVARHDPRFSGPVAALFHDREAEASADEELQAMLDQIELLAKLEEGKK